MQYDGKLAGHRFIDWCFYALILVGPIIVYCIFGGVIKKWSFVLLGQVIQQWNVILACLKCLVGVMGEVLGGSVRALAGGFWCSAPRKKKKKCSHCKRCARAKARVMKWRCRALPVALVERC